MIHVLTTEKEQIANAKCPDKEKKGYRKGEKATYE